MPTINELQEQLQENLSELVSSKYDIKEALIEKGSQPDGGMVTYADAVRKIQTVASCIATIPDTTDIVVFLNGVDITDTVFSDGTATIPNVSGELVITVSKKEIPFSITYILTDVTSSNAGIEIKPNRSYNAVLTPTQYYGINTVTIMMGDEDITQQVYENGNIEIDAVTGDVIITASATRNTHTITNNLSNANNSNSISIINEGESYVGTVTPSEGYNLDNISVVMGTTPVSVSDGNINIPVVLGDIVITAATSRIQHSVAATFNNVSSNNGDTNAYYGDAYSATLTPDAHYAINNVSVQMGGIDITDTAYHNGKITIVKVTGDIVITASAAIITYTITNNLTDVTSNNNAITINDGETYSATLSIPEGYEYSSINVTMGGVQVTSTDISNGIITIPNVTGNIIVTAQAALKSFTVTNSLTNAVSTNNNGNITYGAPYNATITPNQNYTIDTIRVEMGGVDITDTANNNGVISIPSVTGNVVITVVASANNVVVTYNLTNVNSTNTNTEVAFGGSYTTTLSSQKNNWSVNSINVSMGGLDITDSVVSGLTITIPNVTGNIIITATAGKAKDIGIVETTNNAISINDGELTSGAYTLIYEDIDGNPIPNEDIITTFNI